MPLITCLRVFLDPSYPVLKMYFYTFMDNIKNQIQESQEQNVTKRK